MNTEICAVFDSAINGFGQPIFVRTTAQALRSFKDEINRPGSEMGQHPDDYTLYHIGQYDELVGLVTALKNNEVIARGKDVASSESA